MVYNDGKKIFTVVCQEKKNKQNHPYPPQKSQGRPLNMLQIVKVTTGYNSFFFLKKKRTYWDTKSQRVCH